MNFLKIKIKKFSLIEKSINSANKIKQHKAGILLNSEIEKVLKICNLPNKGPYDLDSTCSILSTIFKCQFIIFNAVTNGSNLLYMYPNIYDDSLKPIYMYQPNSTENHLIYIKKLSSFYNRNFRICFCCKKLFKARTSRAPWHLCPSKHSCFSCRRFYQSNTTYIHGNLKSSFCNRYLTNETLFPCNICNVTLYSQHCLESHRRFCAKTGNFGYYCENCKKFTYRQGKSNSIILKNTHKCNASKPCRNCFKSLEENETHQCELKKEKMPITWPRLGFIVHQEFIDSGQLTPCLALIAREEELRGKFHKYTFTESFLDIKNEKETDFMNNKYYTENYELFLTLKKNQKFTDDFNVNLKTLLAKTLDLSLTDKILQLVMNPIYHNTTYICQDNQSIFLNSLLNGLLLHGFSPITIRNSGKILVLQIKSLNI